MKQRYRIISKRGRLVVVCVNSIQVQIVLHGMMTFLKKHLDEVISLILIKPPMYHRT